MKSCKFILAIWLATSAWAQTTPPQANRNPHAGVRPAPGVSRTAPRPATQAPHGVIVRGPGAHGVSVPAVEPRKPRAASVTAPDAYERRHGRRHFAAKPELARRKVVSSSMAVHNGRRDPFVSPIKERAHNAVACVGSGRQCLIVGEITLQGIVQSPSGFIALVANGAHTYFLRDNDPLADGAVEKITPNAITLRQRSYDAVGRPVTREVTKKLGAGPAV